MSTAIILGPVAFDGFEVPERISFGGRQKLVVHTMPGGGRIVDAMGPDEAPIRWSGVFSGPDAGGRVRTLERLRRLGAPLLLAWDAWRYTVIIQDFLAEATNSRWIPYRIELCVVPWPGALVTDWLETAIAPALTVPVLSGVALQQAIASAGIRLGGSDLGPVVSAAGALAQYVTMQAYLGALR